MERTKLALLMLLLPVLYGFDRPREQIVMKRSQTIIYLDGSKGLGYYRDSIVKSAGVAQVWLHMSNSTQSSTNAIERISDILAEIDCEKRRLRFIKMVDSEEKSVTVADPKWDFPSPKSDFYRLVLEVCR